MRLLFQKGEYQMPEAKLHDGSAIEIEVHGAGPTLLLPVNPRPVEGEQAELHAAVWQSIRPWVNRSSKA